MGVCAGFCAIGFLWVDRHWHAPSASEWIYSGGAAGARLLLSTVAGSVITVAGVVFSITIATLTQASSRFGPRLLRNFLPDRGNRANAEQRSVLRHHAEMVYGQGRDKYREPSDLKDLESRYHRAVLALHAAGAPDCAVSHP
jgi:uncharacterized membrane protein